MTIATPRMSAVCRKSGNIVNLHRSSSQGFGQLTAEPSQQCEDLPGDLPSLSWLTTVDVPRLQQMAAGRQAFHNTAAWGSTLQHTDQRSKMNTALGHETMVPPPSNNAVYPGSDVPASGYPGGGVPYCSTLAIQQNSSRSLYNSPFYHNQSLCERHAAVISISDPHSNQDLLGQAKAFPKPIYSYSCLIAMALKNSRSGSLPVSDIYGFMKDHFPYFKTAPDGWKNSVRHNLSLNKCFVKVENKQGGPTSSTRKGCLWALNPAKMDKMEEEMQKGRRKDPTAIRRSMSNPDELDRLITDRPDGCQRKTCDPRKCFPSSACPPPLSGHHFQVLNPACLGDPCSPVPAQTPPLHAVPISQQEPYRPQHGLYSLHPDITAEADALETSIMEFAGNLWEEMTEEGFSLDTLGSPLCLSDCELSASSPEVQPLVDLQVSGLYATPVGPSQYVAGTQAGGRAIALL
ncbi:forkhead box protein N4 isoform X3 [Esox lucius]|uniref:forkhead box protein N4 isoform X3 n=1 Tax=Esox lucius TaxID=8010 RepID=UPI0014775E25|nr:forkhead box protein N4 isoform X3 [Esox lucius]